ncbi:MAG: site-specific integrase [Lutibacter sp.]
MAKINFIVKSKHEGQPATVYLRYSDTRGIDFISSTPEKVFPEYWSFKTQEFKQGILFTELFTEKQKIEIEDRFTEIRAFINKEYFLLKGTPVNKEWLKVTIDKFYSKGIPSNENLNQYIKRFVDEAESGKRLANAGNTKKRYSYGSLRVLRGFMLSFNTFQGIENEGVKPRKGAKEWPKQLNKPLNFNDITIDTYNDFVQFFYSRDCGANYIGKHLKSLKTIMRAAREEGLHSNTEIERKAFKTISEEVESIYLTEAELKKLYELDLSDNKPYQIVRDVFLAGCYTAQRYSDYSKINKSNIKTINGKKFIELIQQKTGEKCIIPIRPELDTILKRYDYTLPKTFEQKVNEGIKKIGEQAKITELIHVEKNKGGLKIKKNIKKCNLIKTHTARRTGCSLMYLAGIPTIDIMKISGHKTPNEFLKYIRISKEETALTLASHPYFLQNTLSIAK